MKRQKGRSKFGERKKVGKDYTAEEPGQENEVHEPDMAYGGLYSYADYLKWTIQERFELIKGKVFRMSLAPNRMHQLISGNIFLEIGNYLRHKPCKVFAAPFDVRLATRQVDDAHVYTVVQPDICVICNPEKLDDNGAIGAPDIVIEILSPGNNTKELRKKYEVYEESGVKEYWVVSPQDKTFLVYRLEAGRFRASRLMTIGDIITTGILPGFTLDLATVFED